MSLDLTIERLVVRAGRARDLLSLPYLAVPAGSLVGVRGPSGAGKSTLLYAIAGLLEAEGRVSWGERDLLALPAEGRARFRAENIGFIFQDFLLFDEMNAIDNAALTGLFRRRATRHGLRRRAADQLEALGLSPDARSVASYSGGERQRVAVARALAGDAGILLADEPTASLHRSAADRLVEDMAALVRASGKTLIAVSHDQHLLDRMDRVLTIEDGALVEETLHA